MAYSIEYCKQCKNKSFDFKQGILCGLTNAKPEYSGICENFENNPEADSKKSSYSSKHKMQEGQVSGGVRFANYIIDVIVFYIIIFILAFVLALSGNAGFVENPLEIRLFFIAGFVIYFTLLEGALKGRTIGKIITGTVAVNEEGNRISFEKALGRSLCRIIPFEAFSFLGSSASGWHDSITKTCVIKYSALKEEVKDNENLLDRGL